MAKASVSCFLVANPLLGGFLEERDLTRFDFISSSLFKAVSPPSTVATAPQADDVDGSL
jgi:hypothetical protein